MLKSMKIGVLRSARQVGVFGAALNSSWRQERLLILCYHGISFEDEHLWRPAYISLPFFRERLEMLASGGYNVLALDEALTRLASGNLPPRSVAITFDDGNYSFYALAYPLLREFGFPVTVYLPTYYCMNQLPVFDVTFSYLLWKGRGQTVDLENETVALSDQNVLALQHRIRKRVNEQGISAEEKDEMAVGLAKRLHFDYEDLRRRRLFHLMTPEETAEVSRHNVAIELHTHRHRTPRDRGLFEREIRDNRKEILAITGREPIHFCYPSGDYVPEFFGWLRESGVKSATTCEEGFATSNSEWMRLPRLLDLPSLTPVEFEGWLTGVSVVLPTRK